MNNEDYIAAATKHLGHFSPEETIQAVETSSFLPLASLFNYMDDVIVTNPLIINKFAASIGLSLATDAESLKAYSIISRLILILHAYKCAMDDENRTGISSKADIQLCSAYCEQIKAWLNHAKLCIDPSCDESGCHIIRQIISHWRNCEDDDCKVCCTTRRAAENGHQVLSRSSSVSSCLSPEDPPHELGDGESNEVTLNECQMDSIFTRRLINGGQQIDFRDQLALVIHASKCDMRDKIADKIGQSVDSCDICSDMKQILQHIKSCNFSRICTFRGCRPTRKLLEHWHNCTDDNCSLCNPFRNSCQNVSSTPKTPLSRSDSGISLCAPPSPGDFPWSRESVINYLKQNLGVSVSHDEIVSLENEVYIKSQSAGEYCFSLSAEACKLKPYHGTLHWLDPGEPPICPICHDEMDVNSPVSIRLRCQHNFHRKCVRNWFVADGSWSCPYCKQTAKSRDESVIYDCNDVYCGTIEAVRKHWAYHRGYNCPTCKFYEEVADIIIIYRDR